MTREELKKLVLEEIDSNREVILGWAKELLKMPERGFREEKTAAYMESRFRELGLQNIKTGMVHTGVSGELRGQTEGGNLVLMGELDAIYCEGHPFADPVTHVAHACGHHAQLVSILGAAAGLAKYMDRLSGCVTLMAVPCEEGVEPEYRRFLMEKENFQFTGGKQEYIRRGYLDNVDAVLMMHTAPVEEVSIGLPVASRSFCSQEITILGREAHAGGEQHLGINAVQCVNLILNAVNGLRETFPNEDLITVNTIVSEGGQSVGTVPGRAVLETNIRARNSKAVQETAEKIVRAVRGCAYALGAVCEIQHYPGYLSLHHPGRLVDVMQENAVALIGAEGVRVMDGAPCIMTDSGDVSNVVPLLQMCIGGGFTGMHHCRDFLLRDPDTAFLLPARLLAAGAVDLLWDRGEALRKVKDSFTPVFDRESYLKYWLERNQ